MQDNNVIIPEETEDVFTEEMAMDVAKELGLGAEANERVMKLREILNGNIPEDVLNNMDIDPSTYDSAADKLDLFKETENDSVSIIDIAINGVNSNKIDISELTAAARESLGSAVTDDDIKTMLNITKRYKDGEKFSVYAALPDIIKEKIMVEVGSEINPSKLNLFAKLLVEEFSSAVFGVAIEKEAIDFNEAIAKALDIPDITIMYEGYIKTKMEDELIAKADALEAEFPDGAKVLRDVSQAFTDSYTFTRLRAAIKGKVRRKLYKENEFFPRLCNEFNARNNKSKFKINDVFEMGRVLYKVMQVVDTGVTEDDIIMFTILFIKACDNYDSTNTADATFMYYTIRNILNMEHHGFIDGGGFKPSEFDTEVLNNVVKLIDDIHVIINERGNK